MVKSNKKSNKNKMRRNVPRRAFRGNNPVRHTTSIPVTLPDMTAFGTSNITLDPSKQSSATKAWASLFTKYKVLKVGISWRSSASLDESSGVLAAIYQADESRALPSTSADAIAQAMEGIGCLIPIKQNSKTWNVPQKHLKNITEGYTPGKAEVPGRIVLATASNATLATPGIVMLHITYWFFGNTIPEPAAAEVVERPIGGDTLLFDDVVWPEGYNPTPQWYPLPAYIRSCFPGVELDGRVLTVYVDTTSDSLILTGTTFADMIERLVGQDIVVFNLFMQQHNLLRVSKNPSSSRYLVSMWPGSVSSKVVAQVDGFDTVVTQVKQSVDSSSVRVDNVEGDDAAKPLYTRFDRPVEVVNPVDESGELVKLSTLAELEAPLPVPITNELDEEGNRIGLNVDSYIKDPLPVPIDDKSKGFFANLLTGAVTAAIPGESRADEDWAPVRLHFPLGGDVDGVKFPDVNIPPYPENAGAQPVAKFTLDRLIGLDDDLRISLSFYVAKQACYNGTPALKTAHNDYVIAKQPYPSYYKLVAEDGSHKPIWIAFRQEWNSNAIDTTKTATVSWHCDEEATLDAGTPMAIYKEFGTFTAPAIWTYNFSDLQTCAYHNLNE